MASPLVAVLEISPAMWLAYGFAIVALAERTATMKVRITRKRKEELLKIAVTDQGLARADVLAELLLSEGPEHGRRGPVEVAFTDPGELQDVHDLPTTR